MRAILLVFLLAAVGLPVAAEAAAPRLDLTYQAVSVDGSLQGAGLLQALAVAPTKDKTELSTLHLEAGDLRVNVMQDATVYVPGGVAASEPATSESNHYLDAVVDAHHLAPDYYLAVVPRPHLEPPQVLVQGDCAALQPAKGGAWTPLAFATPRDWMDASTVIEHALQVSECNQIRAIRIQGHFIVTHWNWQHDLTGKDVEGKAATQQRRSGYEAAQSAGAGTSTQVYFVVTDGVLDFVPGEAKAPFLALAQPVIEGQDLYLSGDLLRAATAGTAVAPPEGDFRAKGLNTLAFGWNTDHDFNVQVTGDAAPSALRPASQGIYAVRQHATWAGWLLLALFAGLLVVASRRPWLRPWAKPADVLDRAKVDHASGRHRSAAWMARYAAWRGAEAGPAYSLVAHAKDALRQTDASLHWFALASRRFKDPEDAAATDYAAACAAARGNAAEEAAERLCRAASLDSTYLGLARENPVFETVKDHETFQAVLDGRLLGGNGRVLKA